MTDLWLAIVRLFDNSAYRCAVCSKVRRGIARRVAVGQWTCSNRCGMAWDEFAIKEHLLKYGTTSPRPWH